jgi:hypothetical protein
MMTLYVREDQPTTELKAQIAALLATHRGAADLLDKIATLRDELAEYRVRSGELHAQLVTLKAVKTGGERARRRLSSWRRPRARSRGAVGARRAQVLAFVSWASDSLRWRVSWVGSSWPPPRRPRKPRRAANLEGQSLSGSAVNVCRVHSSPAFMAHSPREVFSFFAPSPTGRPPSSGTSARVASAGDCSPFFFGFGCWAPGRAFGSCVSLVRFVGMILLLICHSLD